MDTSDIPRKFFIPYRCLIPPVAAGSMIGKGAVILRSLVDETGVEVQILRSEENPRGLDDRILILNGTEKAKGDALQWVLARLRDHFKKNIDEPMTFVSLIPGAASPVVIGNKGSLIRDLMSKYRVEISIGRDRVKGTEDSPMTIKGRSRDIVDAMAHVHHILQELHENGKLVARDFTFCKIFPTVTSHAPAPVEEPTKTADRPVGNAPVRLVVTGDEMNVLVSNEGIKQVEQIEDKHACKITVEEAPSPPLISSEEVLCVRSDNVQDKYRGVDALLRLLMGMNKQRSAGVLMDAKIAGKVIGSRGVGINRISQKSECFLKLRREGDPQKESFSLMECSGSPEAQLTAIELLVKRIDSFTEDETKPVEAEHTLTVRIAVPISDDILRDIQRSSRCEIRSEVGGPEFELRGSRSEISKAVYELLAHNVIEEDKAEPPAAVRNRRRPEQSSDEEIDYS